MEFFCRYIRYCEDCHFKFPWKYHTLNDKKLQKFDNKVMSKRTGKTLKGANGEDKQNISKLL